MMTKMSDTEYYCNNCGARIKPTDTTCPKCGKNINEVGKTIKKTFGEVLGLADSAQTITGSLANGYAQLSGTFSVQQRTIAEEYNFGPSLEVLKSISESEKEQIRIMEQQRNDAIEDAKKQRKRFYISTAIAVAALVVAVAAVIASMLR
jgi:hypothetical protein